MLLVLLLIRTGLRSKGPGPQSPQEVGCVARVCVLQGIGRAGGGQGHMLREQLAVTSCVFKETEIPILWAEAKRVKRRKDTPTPPPPATAQAGQVAWVPPKEQTSSQGPALPATRLPPTPSPGAPALGQPPALGGGGPGASSQRQDPYPRV